MKQRNCRFLAWGGLLLFANICLASDSDTSIPKHLELARELVATVKPENNKYVLRGPDGVRWKGDLLTSENTVNAHCTGFVGAVLERAKSQTVKEVESKTYWKKYLRVDNYYEAVTKGYGFTQIAKLGDAKPGDVFLFRCNDPCGNSQTNDVQGHITIIDVTPTQKKPTPPIIDGTLQWVVTIIDSADSPHSKDDTRNVADGMQKVTGVGRGTYRVYTDAEGMPVGYTTGPNHPKFHDIKDRPIAVGRPLPY